MMEINQIGFDPIIPEWGLGVAISLSILVWLIYALRSVRARVLRALVLVGLGLLLANPVIIHEQREPLNDIVTVIMDRSDSMQIAGRDIQGQSAYEQLLEYLQAQEGLDIRTADIAQTDGGTKLTDVMQSVFSDIPRNRIAGTVVITDGQMHDTPDSLENLEKFGPVHVFLAGDPDFGDRRLSITKKPAFGIVNEDIRFMVRIDDPVTQMAELRIELNGKNFGEMRIPTGQATPIIVDIPRRGDNMIYFSTPEGAQELTTANNHTTAVVSGIRDRLRVLLITGKPHSGSRAMRDLLKSDPAVDLVHFTILKPPYKSETATIDELALIGFPTRELFAEKLQEFDLIIFDRFQLYGVLPFAYFNNIADYIAQGGGLFIIAGPQFAGDYSLYRTPLASILPARPTGKIYNETFQPVLSRTGHHHSVTAPFAESAKDWGHWQRYVDTEIVAGSSLINGPDNKPILVLNREKQGRVAELMSDQIWLWARGYNGGGPYAELIRRIVHWLMKEPELEEEKLDLVLENGKAQLNLRSLSDTPPSLKLQTPKKHELSAQWQKISPGNYSASIFVEETGIYRARAGKLEALALNGPSNPVEYTDLRSTADILLPLVVSGNGGYFWLQELGDKLPAIRWINPGQKAYSADWIGFKRNDTFQVTARDSFSLIPELGAVWILLIFLLWAWFREGK